MNNPALALACTVQAHPCGGYTPTLHLPTSPVPQPSRTSLAFTTVGEAIRHALNDFHVTNVMVAPTTEAAPVRAVPDSTPTPQAGSSALAA